MSCCRCCCPLLAFLIGTSIWAACWCPSRFHTRNGKPAVRNAYLISSSPPAPVVVIDQQRGLAWESLPLFFSLCSTSRCVLRVDLFPWPVSLPQRLRCICISRTCTSLWLTSGARRLARSICATARPPVGSPPSASAAQYLQRSPPLVRHLGPLPRAIGRHSNVRRVLQPPRPPRPCEQHLR